MSGYEYVLDINKDGTEPISFNNILDIPVPSDIKENLYRIYGTEKINIYQVMNEYEARLRIYVSDTDDRYEVTDLYQKLCSKVVNTMYSIYAKRDRNYRRYVSETNLSALMSEWNIFRKNHIQKYEALKKSIGAANYILSCLSLEHIIFETDDYKKYYAHEKSRIDRIEKSYSKKIKPDEKYIKFTNEEIENNIKFSYLLKRRNYICPDEITFGRNKSLLNLALASDEKFEELFLKLLKKGIYLQKTENDIIAIATSNSLYGQFLSGESLVNTRPFRFSGKSYDWFRDDYFIHYMEGSNAYLTKRQEWKEHLESVHGTSDWVRVKTVKSNIAEYEKFKNHKLFPVFLSMKNTRDRFMRLLAILEKGNFPARETLDDEKTDNDKVYASREELLEVMESLSEKYMSDFNRKLKSRHDKYLYTRYLYLDGWTIRHPNAKAEIDGKEKILVANVDNSGNVKETTISTYSMKYIDVPYMACPISDILSYIAIESLTQDKIAVFNELKKVRGSFSLKDFDSDDIKKILSQNGEIGTDISNRIKMFKRDFVKNSKVRERVDVRISRSRDFFSGTGNIYEYLERLNEKCRMIGKVKEKDIIPLMFKIRTLNFPCITANDIQLEVNRYKKYSISSKDSVFVVDRTENANFFDSVIDCDYLMYLCTKEMGQVFRYSAIIKRFNRTWCVIRKHLGIRTNEKEVPAIMYFNEISALEKIYGHICTMQEDIDGHKFSGELMLSSVFSLKMEYYAYLSKIRLLPTRDILYNTVDMLKKKIEPYLKDVQFYYINSDTAHIMDREAYRGKVFLNGLRDDDNRRLVSLEKQIFDINR
jgi:hypothetical protein